VQTGRLVLCSALALLGCGSSRPPGVTTSTSPGPGCAVSGECNTANPGEAASASPGTTWLAAFEAGSGTNEALWLLPVEGAPARIVAAAPPSGSETVVTSQSTFGYDETAGHVGHVAFDAEREQLWVGVAQGDHHDVQRLDLATGRWETLATSDDVPLIAITNLGPVVVTTSGSRTTIAAFLEDQLVEAFSGADVPRLTANDLRPYTFDGHERLYVAGVAHVALDGERFAPTSFPDGFPDTPLAFDVAPDGARACATVSASEGGDTPGRVWMLDGAGEHDFPVPSSGELTCTFTRRGQVVVVQARFPERRTTFLLDLNGDVLTDLADAEFRYSDDAYGYFTVHTDVYRIEWETLRVTTLVQFGDDADLAESELWYLDGGLLVERHTGCIDCHSSGLWWVALDGTVSTELLAARERSLLQVAILDDGTALVAHSDNDEDTLLRVHPEGEVTELGPFDGIDTLPHAPVAL